MSHAELDEATELDDGDPVDLGARYAELAAKLPNLNVLGAAAPITATCARRARLGRPDRAIAQERRTTWGSMYTRMT